MRKMSDDEKRIPTSVAFDQDILARIDEAKGRLSRSTFINISLEKVLKIESKKSRPT